MAVVFGVWLTCGFLGALIGARNSSPVTGALCGFLFGPLGVILAFAADGRAKCPHCKSRVEKGAAICPGCRSPLAKAVDAPPPLRYFNCPHPKCNARIFVDPNHSGDVTVCQKCRE